MAAETNSEAPRAKSSRLVPLLLILNTVLVGGLGAVFFLRGDGSSGPEAVKEAEASDTPTPAATTAGPGLGPVLKLEDFVVHLRNPESNRYVRVNFEVELMSEPDVELIKARMPVVRDRVISYLSDLTVEDFKGSEGIRKTKTDLLAQLDAVIPGRKVRALYVTNLIIQ